jgi:hypothetical protein
VKRAAPIFMGVVAVIFAALPAGAKELHSARICGKSKCVMAKEQRDMQAFAFTESSSSEPPSGPFYTVQLSVLDGSGDKESWTLDYMPDAERIRVAGEFGDDWWTLSPGAATRLRALMGDVEPFPATAFQAAMDEPPGTFTTGDLAALPDSSTAARPASSPRPDSSGANWLIPVVTLLGLAVLASVGFLLQHRRSTPIA